ncbi:MAG: gliding motility-associated C-terminal domain-containing protein [Flavobacteriales bacterium]
MSIILPVISMGQNLVPNPSFESVTSCPSFASQLDRAAPWYNPTLGTPELYHGCAPLSSYVSVPQNTTGGYQLARTGEGYVGLYTYRTDIANMREYAEIQLLEPLVAGRCYTFSMFVNMPNDHPYAVDGFGAHFSADPLTSTDGFVLPVSAHIENPSGSFITDTLGWTEISGVYTALGGEAYLTIGNFNDDATTQVLQVATGLWHQTSGYLLVDDVSLMELELNVDLGPDTLLCDAASLLLDAANPGAEYLWSDGSTGPTLVVSAPGTYWVRVAQGACSASDTVQVSGGGGPVLSLPREVLICPGNSVVLDASANGSVQWMDGDTNAVRNVGIPGTYTVVATNACGNSTATTEVVQDRCPCVPFLPNAFTPNGDGINDTVGPRIQCGVGTLRWSVYDRWGRLLWEANDGNAEWDGSVDGVPVPNGVYAWRMDLIGVPDVPDRYMGHLTVLR